MLAGEGVVAQMSDEILKVASFPDGLGSCVSENWSPQDTMGKIECE